MRRYAAEVRHPTRTSSRPLPRTVNSRYVGFGENDTRRHETESERRRWQPSCMPMTPAAVGCGRARARRLDSRRHARPRDPATSGSNYCLNLLRNMLFPTGEV